MVAWLITAVTRSLNVAPAVWQGRSVAMKPCVVVLLPYTPTTVPLSFIPMAVVRPAPGTSRVVKVPPL